MGRSKEMKWAWMMLAAMCCVFSTSAIAKSYRSAILYGDYRCDTLKKIKLLREFLQTPAVQHPQMSSEDRMRYRQEVTDQIWEFCLATDGRMSTDELLERRRTAIHLALGTFGRDLTSETFVRHKSWWRLESYLKESSLPSEAMAPDGWTAYHAAHEAANFLNEMNAVYDMGSDTEIIPIRFPQEYGDFLAHAAKTGGYDAIIFFAHSGIYDGYRFGSQGVSPLPKLAQHRDWPKLKDSMIDVLVDREGFDRKEAARWVESNLNHGTGSWEVKQSGVVRFWLDNHHLQANRPQARIHQEIAWLGIRVPEDLLTAALCEDGTLFLGGCKNHLIAQNMLHRFQREGKSVTIFSFTTGVSLHVEVMDVFKDYFSGGDESLTNPNIQVLVWP